MPAQQSFGRFENLRELRKGGMGEVYLAFDPSRGEDVVLKRVPLDGEDPGVLPAQRLGATLQEKLAVHGVRVPAVFETGDLDGYFYVAMQYVAGNDLSSLLVKERHIPPDRALSWGRSLCEILDSSHNLNETVGGELVRSIVHADIKLENLQLTNQGELFLIDFGTAKALTEKQPLVQNDFATPSYMPPEYAESGRQVNCATDLWAAGVVLYKLLCGRFPFRGATDEEIFDNIRLARLRPPPEDLPVKLESILARSLAHRPKRRYPTAAAFSADLDAFLLDRPLAPETLALEEAGDDRTRRTVASADEDGRTRRTQPRPASPETAAGSAEAEAPARTAWRRRPALWAAAAAIALFFGAQVYAQAVARQVVRELTVEVNPDLERAWDRYTRARRLSIVPLTKAKGRLHAAYLDKAESLFLAYRENPRTVACSDWLRAQPWVERATRLRPDSPTKARQLYVHGQVRRLMTERKCDLPTRSTYAEATELLEKAAALDAQWTDPLLALVVIHAWRQFDFERLRATLEEIETRGFPQTVLTRSAYADGYKEQCGRLAASAKPPLDPARQVELLEQADQLCALAESWYRQIPQQPGTPDGLRTVSRRRRDIAMRKEKLLASDPLRGWGWGQ